MHHYSLVLLTATSYVFSGASALPTDSTVVGNEIVPAVTDELTSPNYINKRASIFDLCFKSPNPPPRNRTDNVSRFLNIEAAASGSATEWQQATGNRHTQYQAWTTDNLGTFRGRFIVRLHPLFHPTTRQFRWTLSWRRGGTEGCVRGGTLSIAEDQVDFNFPIDSTMEYFFTVESE
ncbi:hypothetical protein CKAH01_19083 [Colletotrichum kahawae]|uniref:Uncharacterized protein n=1 Tax=Colletotrichum kahawae TaxID=34407 RepID=A0AAD9XZI0_COLKA|nr:hypothetical protein CKAH01_19083 [Colletotrichum kahawae]